MDYSITDKEPLKRGKKRKRSDENILLSELDNKEISTTITDNLNEAGDIKINERTPQDFVPLSSSTDTNSTRSISIALPGSILDNVPTDELKTYVIGQIARAASIFNVKEIIIFNEFPHTTHIPDSKDIIRIFINVLQYLETPQYLRKLLFPKHPDLKHAGILHPLNCPHHMKQNEWTPYREGVVLDKPSKKGSYANIGLTKDVRIDQHLQSGIRVTVKMKEPRRPVDEIKHYKGKVVSPFEPSKFGYYWGYVVRYASSLNNVFTDCTTFEKPYDLLIGTSDKGTPISKIELPDKFERCLIVFGGLRGIEGCLESDEEILTNDPKQLFNFYINSCPNQGSKTIRTEEAIFITLASLQDKL